METVHGTPQPAPSHHDTASPPTSTPLRRSTRTRSPPTSYSPHSPARIPQHSTRAARSHTRTENGPEFDKPGELDIIVACVQQKVSVTRLYPVAPGHPRYNQLEPNRLYPFNGLVTEYIYPGKKLPTCQHALTYTVAKVEWDDNTITYESYDNLKVIVLAATWDRLLDFNGAEMQFRPRREDEGSFLLFFFTQRAGSIRLLPCTLRVYGHDNKQALPFLEQGFNGSFGSPNFSVNLDIAREHAGDIDCTGDIPPSCHALFRKCYRDVLRLADLYSDAPQQYERIMKWARLLPALLLYRPALSNSKARENAIPRRLKKFMKGEWKSLYDELKEHIATQQLVREAKRELSRAAEEQEKNEAAAADFMQSTARPIINDTEGSDGGCNASSSNAATTDRVSSRDLSTSGDNNTAINSSTPGLHQQRGPVDTEHAHNDDSTNAVPGQGSDTQMRQHGQTDTDTGAGGGAGAATASDNRNGRAGTTSGNNNVRVQQFIRRNHARLKALTPERRRAKEVRHAQAVALRNARKGYRMVTQAARPAMDHAEALAAKFPGPDSLNAQTSVVPTQEARPSPPSIDALQNGTATRDGAYTTDKIRRLLRRKKFHGGADLNGLQMREHLYVLYDSDDEELHDLLFKHFLYPYFDHVNTLLANTKDPLGVLMGQLKVNKDGVPTGDVRPLVTGDAWGRLVMSLALADCAAELGKWFLTSVLNVKQYGVGVKDGLAQCIHTLRLQLEAGMIAGDSSDPICALVTDLSNAFNELGRDALFQMLLDKAKEGGP